MASKIIADMEFTKLQENILDDELTLLDAEFDKIVRTTLQTMDKIIIDLSRGRRYEEAHSALLSKGEVLELSSSIVTRRNERRLAMQHDRLLVTSSRIAEMRDLGE